MDCHYIIREIKNIDIKSIKETIDIKKILR